LWPPGLASIALIIVSLPADRLYRHHGFSFLEIMLVTALLAIIVSLATPSYRSLTLRSNRAEAISQLLQLSACQERIRAISGMYDTRGCLVADDEYYSYRYEPAGAAATASFVVKAVPLAKQNGDICGALILDQNGHREVGNENSEPGKCWAGR